MLSRYESRAVAHFVPGGQALNIAGKDVARAHRHAHAQDGFGSAMPIMLVSEINEMK